MFNFSSLKQIHLEITNNCQASCPMCSRNYHGGMANPLLRLTDWTLDEFKTIINSEVLAQINSIFFCGNFGDPLLNDDLIHMCKYLKDNSNISIRIHTNGSLRNTEWWQNLYQAMPENHMIIFGIDGLEDTHARYRIGTNFNKIIQNAKTFIDAGGNAEWAYIEFKHNEHQTEQAEIMAAKLGFKRFTVKQSSRFVGSTNFPVYDKNGVQTDVLQAKTNSTIKFVDANVIKNYKKIIDESTIHCQALDQKEIYIDAHKNLFPCCFLASAPYNYYDRDEIEIMKIRQEMLHQYNSLVQDLGTINTMDKSIKEIVNSTEYQTVWEKYWTTKKLITCVRICGKTEFSKPNDQFIEKKLLS